MTPTTAATRGQTLVDGDREAPARTRRRHLGDRRPSLGPLPPHVRRRTARRRTRRRASHAETPTCWRDQADDAGRLGRTGTACTPPAGGNAPPTTPPSTPRSSCPAIRGAARCRRPSQPRHHHRGPRGPDRRRLRLPVPPARPTGPCTKPRAPSSCAGSSCPWPSLNRGRREDALRWFERNRAALGPPGLFAEEYDVVQRQLRGNLPQAFVHALLLESAHRLGEAGVNAPGFPRRPADPAPPTHPRTPPRRNTHADPTKSPRVVVITGASGGIGRASARLFAAQGDHVALLARGSTGLEAAAREVRDLGGTALPISVDTADHEALEHAADRVEAELGPIDVWVNDAFTSVFARFVDIEPEEFRRVTEVTYLGFVNGTRSRAEPDAAARPRRDRPGRVRPGPPRDPAAVGLLRRQARHVGLPRVPADRAAPRPQQRPRHLRGDARASTPRSSAGCCPSCRCRRNRFRRSTSPRSPPAASCTPPTTPNDAPTGSAPPPSPPSSATASPAVLLDRYLARTGVASQQTDDPKPSDQPANLFEPADEHRDYGAHGLFDDRAFRHSPQAWASQHRRVLATAAATAALAGGRRTARQR